MAFACLIGCVALLWMSCLEIPLCCRDCMAAVAGERVQELQFHKQYIEATSTPETCELHHCGRHVWLAAEEVVCLLLIVHEIHARTCQGRDISDQAPMSFCFTEDQQRVHCCAWLCGDMCVCVSCAMSLRLWASARGLHHLDTYTLMNKRSAIQCHHLGV